MDWEIVKKRIEEKYPYWSDIRISTKENPKAKQHK